jgi:hypothetical protein
MSSDYDINKPKKQNTELDGEISGYLFIAVIGEGLTAARICSSFTSKYR